MSFTIFILLTAVVALVTMYLIKYSKTVSFKLIYYRYKYPNLPVEIFQKGWLFDYNRSEKESALIEHMCSSGDLVTFKDLGLNFMNDEYFCTFKGNPFNVRIHSEKVNEGTISQPKSDLTKTIGDMP